MKVNTADLIRGDALGRLADALVHKLRNSLNTLQTQIAILEKLTAVEAQGPVGRQIFALSESVMRMEGVLQQFQAYAHPPAPRREVVSISSLMEQVLNFLKADFEQARICVEAVLPAGLPPVSGDTGQIRQAIINLLVNAKEAMPEGGRLIVRTLLGSRGNVLLDIRDTGCGIRPENRRRIAQPFFSTKPGGLGLGLSIARRAIRNQGGKLTFESHPGKGTCFRISLPSAGPRSTEPAGGDSAGPGHVTRLHSLA